MRPARLTTLFTMLESLGASVICYTKGIREEIIQIPLFFSKTFPSFLNVWLEMFTLEPWQMFFALLKVYWGITCTTWPEFFFFIRSSQLCNSKVCCPQTKEWIYLPPTNVVAGRLWTCKNWHPLPYSRWCCAGVY